MTNKGPVGEPGKTAATGGDSNGPAGAAAPYSGVLPEIVRSLRRQPILLFGLGGGILILAASSAVLGDQRSITIPLLIVLAIAAVGWIGLEALRVTKRRKTSGRTRTGRVNVGGAEIGDKTTLRTGVSGVAPGGDTSTGDISVGRGARLGKGVRIDTGVSGQPDQPRNKE